MTTLVRCVDRTVFPIDPVTLEPKRCGAYDPWCYTDPEPGIEYIEHSEWCLRLHALERTKLTEGR
jgi:hypothetical protein